MICSVICVPMKHTGALKNYFERGIEFEFEFGSVYTF